MQMPIPDDWDGVTTCRWAVCWPDSVKWKAILYGLIESPMRGRFWDFSTGNFIELRELFKPTYDYNFELGEVIMACNDSGISEGLSAIASAIASLGTSGCGCGSTTVNCGSGGAGASQQAPTEIEGDVGEGASPPEGFETIGEYRTYKCDMATHIVSTYKADLTRLGAISDNLSWVANKLAIVCAGLLLTPLPGDELFALATLIISTLAADIWSDTLSLMQDAITEAEEDLVCALYEASSVQSAIASFESVMGASIDSLGTLPYTYAAKQFITPFTTTDNLNRLFARDDSLTLPSGDCSGCGNQGQDPGLVWVYGQGDLTCDGQQRTLTAESDGAGSYYVRWENTTDCIEYSLRIVSVSSLFPFTEIDVHNCNSDVIYAANVYVNDLVNGPSIAFGNKVGFPGITSFGWTQPFTMDVILDTVA